MNRMFLILAALFLIHTAAEAQTERRIYTQAEQTEAQQRALEKQMQEMQDSVNYAHALEALNKLDFVLEADKLVFKRGNSAFVSSTTNFVSLKDDRAVVQIAPFNGGGPNGVGGITLEDRASNITVKTDRKGNTYFTMNVMGSGLSAAVTFTLPKGSNNATVTVDPTFSSNRVTFYGRLVPTARSRVYEGRSF